MKKGHFNLYKLPKLENPSLVIGWSEDAGRLGPGVIDFLKEKLGAEKFCEIEPFDFFPLGGVAIKHDLIQFPESEFYSCESKNLVLFKSNPPSYEWYKFLNIVLDIADKYCGVKELYTIGGILTSSAHTSPRRISTVVNRPELKEMLAKYGCKIDLEYRTPPGARPTLSSFLLWAAKRRNIGGANLWGEVPYYLAAQEDPRACETLIELFDKRFKLGIDFGEINRAIEKQEEMIGKIRMGNPEVDEYIRKLETFRTLTHDESEKLVNEIENLLKNRP